MRLTAFISAILISGLVLMGFVNLVGGFQQSYNITTPLNSSFNSTFVKIGEMQNLTREMSAQVEGSNVETSGIVDFFTTLATGVYTSAKLVFGSFGVAEQMLTNTAQSIPGLPEYVVGVIVTMVLLGVLGWFLFAIFKIPS